MQTHRIGGNSEFDFYMDEIDDFIKCKNNPSDHIINSSVFSYYYSRALSYWSGIEDFINGDFNETTFPKSATPKNNCYGDSFIINNYDSYQSGKIIENINHQ